MKVITFDGKQIIEPGAYANMVGGEPDAPESATSGNTLFIDTGSMAKYGYGSGITGSLASGANSIYGFTTLDDFKKAIGGGIMWDASNWLWKPSKALNIQGIQKLWLVHARTTTKSVIVQQFVGGGTRASGTVTYSSNPTDTTTITLNGIAYTYKTTPSGATEVLIGSTLAETLVNLAEKVAQSQNASITVAQYTAEPTLIRVTYKVAGTAGNAYTLAASVGTVSGATLSGGLAGSGANGGVFAVDAIIEGIGANGLVDPTSTELYTGFGMKIVAGIVDTAKFSVEFYRGTYHGLDWNGVPFDDISRSISAPVLVAKSSEFSTLQELFDWADEDVSFALWFKRNKTASSINGTGALLAADTTTYSGYNLFTKGSESYSPSDLTKVYEYVKELDYSFMLSDKYEDDMDDTVNYQHISHINLKSEFKRTMYIGGGADATKFSQSGGSIPIAATFDDENVHIVHSRVGKTNSNNVLKEYPSLYHAAAAVGRAAGATAQTPMTFKDLDFTYVKHILSEDERKTAIQAGVQHLRSVDGISGLVVNLDGNTKQRNKQDIYADGTSPFGSIVRIKNLLNRTIAKNCRAKFVGQNANQASPADVKSYVETILTLSTCTKTEDNLILSFKNVKAVLLGSDYRVTYGAVPNGPVNRLFITGTMFTVSASA